jgi:hypothetical protein
MIKHIAKVNAYTTEQVGDIKALADDLKEALANKQEIEINGVAFIPKQAVLETHNHGSSLTVEGYIL